MLGTCQIKNLQFEKLESNLIKGRKKIVLCTPFKNGKFPLMENALVDHANKCKKTN